MALPFVGVGLLYRQGLLPPDDRRRRPPGARLPRLRPQPAAAQPASRTRTAMPLTRHRRAARPRPVGRRLAGPGRPRAGAAARHRRRRERRRGPADHPHPVRPRPRDAAAPGARPRRRRRARAPGARASRPPVWHLNEGHSAFLLAERARELVAAGATLDEAWTAGPAEQRVHDPHAGLGRQRALRRRPRAPRRRPARSTPARRAGRAGPRARPRRRRRPRPVRHDRVLAAPDQRRERRQPAPRARPPTRPGRASSTPTILGITNGVHPPDLGRPADRRAARALPRTPTSTRLDAELAPGPVLGAPRPDPDRRAVGGAPAPEARAGASSPAAGCAASSPATARRRRSLAELESVLDPDVLTIGFARRFATYKRAALLFSDIDRLAPAAVGRGAAGPDHLRGQGPPGRPARPARHPGDLPAGRARRSCAAGSSSSRTTTCGSGGSSSRASTSGSTTRAGRSRRRARRA